MSVRFRIDTVRLDTRGGPVTHDFDRDLTVLVGQTGVGKTTLFELIKHGLGGKGMIAPVARDNVTDVHLSISVGDERLQLSRSLESSRAKVVRVRDLVADTRLPDRNVGGDEMTISDLLLSAMGLPTDVRAAARGGRSTRQGDRITFNDIFRFMYVPQAEMNHDIAASTRSYLTAKRKTVFELLFGLTSNDILLKQSEVNRLKGEIETATREVEVVQQFLADTGLTSRFDAETNMAQVETEEAAAREALSALESGLADVVDRQAQVLREMLNDAERSLADARALALEVEQQRHDYASERRRLRHELDRFMRMASAGLRLADIEFSVCPRCTQRLDQREIPSDACPVCLQHDVIAGLSSREPYEDEQLRGQLQEVDDQLAFLDGQRQQVDAAVVSRASLVESLTNEVDERTASRITPRLRVYADAVARVQSAASDQKAVEQTLRQWDRAEDLAQTAEDLAIRRSRLRQEIREDEAELARRKDEILSEVNAEFEVIVADFGIPSIQSAAISRDSYLPILNGGPFSEASSGGGIITATQVAYWLTLVTVAARQRDTSMPLFLMLDTPRLALNADHDIAGQMYRRFWNQVQTTPGRLQFIIADNERPSSVERDARVLAFSFETPTVDTIEHPGPADLETLKPGVTDD